MTPGKVDAGTQRPQAAAPQIPAIPLQAGLAKRVPPRSTRDRPRVTVVGGGPPARRFPSANAKVATGPQRPLTPESRCSSSEDP